MMTELYRHWGEDGRLLYVGISKTTAARMAQHATTSHWFQKVSNITIERFETREEALAAEREAIAKESPLFNIVHSASIRPRDIQRELKENGWRVGGEEEFECFLTQCSRILLRCTQQTEDKCRCSGREWCERCEDTGYVLDTTKHINPRRAEFWDRHAYEMSGQVWGQYPMAWRLRIEDWGHEVAVLEVVYHGEPTTFAGSRAEWTASNQWWAYEGTDKFHVRVYLAHDRNDPMVYMDGGGGPEYRVIEDVVRARRKAA